MTERQPPSPISRSFPSRLVRNIQDRPSPFLAERVAEAKAPTFEQAAQAYIRAHRAGWKSPKSLVSCEHTLSAFAYPVIGKLPVDAIDTDLVMKVLDQEITDGPDGKPFSTVETRSPRNGRLDRRSASPRPKPRHSSKLRRRTSGRIARAGSRQSRWCHGSIRSALSPIL